MPETKRQKERFFHALWNDLKSGLLKSAWAKDLREINAFYIDREAREKLNSMKGFRRWMHQAYYLVRSLFLKLPPARRALLVAAVIFFYIGRQEFRNIHVDLVFISVVIFLFILALELKDKLLAHDELSAGRAVQRALLPDHHPELAGWRIYIYTRPANEVGGDLVDYIHMDGDRMGLFLGDVAGKGLGAALFMTKLQATIRALAPGAGSLDGLGAEINRIFCRDGIPSRFISLIYCELSRGNGRIRYFNAGHFPPLVRRKGRIEELGQGQVALGIMAGAEYGEEEIVLKPEDLMLIYSDGVTEARNTDGDFYGETRLKNLIESEHRSSVDRIGESLLNDVSKFMGDALPSDDLSFILIKRLA